MNISKGTAEKYAHTLSDVVCFLRGYRAGRQGEIDLSEFINMDDLIDLNIKLKQAAIKEEDKGELP